MPYYAVFLIAFKSCIGTQYYKKMFLNYEMININKINSTFLYNKLLKTKRKNISVLNKINLLYTYLQINLQVKCNTDR